MTITLPDAGKRFMSMQVIDEDQYTHGVIYQPGSHTLSRDNIGTRYVLVALRILVDPANPQDVAQVHALQDAITVSQAGPGRFEVPAWDPASQKKVRDALLTLAQTLPDLTHMFGTKEQVDPVRRLIGSASTWGGNPEKDAMYLNVTPSKNDGTTVHKLVVKDVPVDGFWSISVYDAKGYFHKNGYDAYTLNNVTAGKREDGSVAVQFGRLRREDPQLPPDHSGVELHGPALPSASRDPGRHVEVSSGGARELKVARSALVQRSRPAPARSPSAREDRRTGFTRS